MNLRRLLTALAVMAVFAALASAQGGIAGSTVTCTVSAPTAPNIRSEGVTERVGDVKLTCTGGLAPVVVAGVGPTVDRATITIDYGVNLTSRLDGATTNSEIALTIDEPGTVTNGTADALQFGGYGPNTGRPATSGVALPASIIPCSVAAAPCAAFAVLSNGGYWVLSNNSASPALAGAAATPGADVYQGVIATASPTKVTFTNVPLIPPVASGVQRIFRITNVRVNPNGSTAAINATVTGSVASGVSTLSLSGSAQVATPLASLTTSAVGTAVSACVTSALNPGAGQAKANTALLKFNQGFATAFKPKQLALSGAAADNGITGTGANLINVTGSYVVGTSNVVNNSESGLVATFGALTAGLADSGTRLKAVFTGLDSKATYYVSLNPVADYADAVTGPTAIGDTTAIPYAALTSTQGSAGETTLPFVAAATAGTANSTGIPAATQVQVAAVSVGTGTSAGKAEVVWEVTNFKQNTADAYTFALYAVYPSTAPPAVTTGAGTATVALSYAATNGSSTTTPVGYTTSQIPRYSVVNATNTFFTVLPCQTTLLFPYVTNAGTATAHWETGFAIENTGSDPLGTVPVSAGGSCTLSFYGAGAPPAITTAAIAPGAQYAAVVSNPANASPAPAYASFSGYMFAVCNFNFAHGFAFVVSDYSYLLSSNTAMGYLALVVASPGSSAPARGSLTLGEAYEN